MIMVFLSVGLCALLTVKYSLLITFPFKIYPCFFLYICVIETFPRAPNSLLPSKEFCLLCSCSRTARYPRCHSSILFHFKCLHYSSSYLQGFSKYSSLSRNKGDPGSLLISKEFHDVWHKTQYYHSDREKLLCSLDLSNK